MVEENPENLVILSGCSSGGKSTLLLELERRGFQITPEAGRRVVQEGLRTGADVLPWNNPAGFAQSTARLAMLDYRAIEDQTKPTFFDRSPLDLAAHLDMLSLPFSDDLLRALQTCAYAKTVFMTPPWPEIFHQDAERQKTFEDAVMEYEHLLKYYQRQGYQPHLLPKTTVSERADYVMDVLGLDPF